MIQKIQLGNFNSSTSNKKNNSLFMLYPTCFRSLSIKKHAYFGIIDHLFITLATSCYELASDWQVYSLQENFYDKTSPPFTFAKMSGSKKQNLVKKVDKFVTESRRRIEK